MRQTPEQKALLVGTAQMRGVMAATPTSDAGGSDTDAQPLPEVTVTANRREESVLSVPYNISAVTGAELRKAGAGDVQSLSTLCRVCRLPTRG